MLHAAWVIPACPLAGFVLLILVGRRLGDPFAGWLATLVAGGSFVFSVIVFAGLLGRSADNRLFVQTLWDWIPVGGFKVATALQLDPLSVTMCLFVTGVGSLIHLYSIGYMKGDPRYYRFFVYLNLFLFSMLMLVLGANFLITFLGWEGVGTCSYLLISFWFERDRAASAGKKAFVTNRVGDWGFMIGIFLIFSHFGSIAYTDVLSKTALGQVGQSTATWICLALFLGAVGKSAQLPLFVWLPDAMEGPTPVSALIHAATMVTAGVYLLCRISPLLAKAPDAALVIACVGAATAFVAATIACAQDDIKRVLAYSTISQLGYMFVAVGSGAYVAGVFHMVTHAFFKALLFLGAGAVIHGMHDQQDMKRMGGLLKWMPVTGWTFIVGALALSGIVPFAGFWSKDDILAATWVYHGWVGHLLYVVLLATAGLTAYYMSRQVALVFRGRERWRDPVPAADHATADDHAHAPGDHGDAQHREPHEAPWVMLLPLCVLALLAFFGGALNLPYHPWNLLEKWLDPVVGAASSARHISHAGKAVSAVVATAVALSGLAVGLRIWQPSAEHDALEPAFLKRAWLIDWLYGQVIERPGAAVSSFAAWVIDKRVIDGSVNGVGALVRGGGSQLRKLQTGYVRNYALGIAAGTVVILAYMVFRVS
ncbi:MAG: NADH-quinone oxidoreductase subunit L [Acidimicrobiales bacterium]